MNDTSKVADSAVEPEEVERRIEEYRRLGWERRGPAHVVYHNSDQPCPWPECGMRIAGIDFQLEKMGKKSLQEQLLFAWWRGPGLVGRCPECGRFVLFALQHKQKVPDVAPFADALLPDQWDQKAYLVCKPTQ